MFSILPTVEGVGFNARDRTKPLVSLGVKSWQTACQPAPTAGKYGLAGTAATTVRQKGFVDCTRLVDENADEACVGFAQEKVLP